MKRICEKYKLAVVGEPKAKAYLEDLSATVPQEDLARWEAELLKAEGQRLKNFKAMDI